MIVFSNKCGQLGNRLFAFAHLIAFGKANGIHIVNLSFDEYAKYFEITNKDIFCQYPSSSTIIRSNKLRSWLFVLNKIVLKFLRGIKVDQSSAHSIVIADLPEYQFNDMKYYNMNDSSFINKAKQHYVTFLFGRFFRDYENFEKYQDVIRTYFKPNESIIDNVDLFIKKARIGTDLLVGVHIRRGDYKHYVDGKYFYSWSQYALKMKELKNDTDGKKVKFILCSNEKLEEQEFVGIDFMKGPNHLVKDMYVLSSCDLIMGPPSTYSLWASFYGKKPLYQIRDINKKIETADFVILPPNFLYNFSFN